MQIAQNIVEFAQFATQYGTDAIVIECVNSGGDQRFARSFPAVENARDLCDGPLVLIPNSKDEAIALFDTIVSDYRDAGGELLDTTIHHVQAGKIVNSFTQPN